MVGGAPVGVEPDTDVARSAWLALGVTMLVFFLVVIDVSAVNVAFPTIATDLDTDETTLSWIVSGYNVTVAALLLVVGRLADSHGRKRLFMPGLAVFGVGSLLCGLAPSVELLIAARVLQAVGGAVISPTALAVVLPDFPPHRRSMAIGLTGGHRRTWRRLQGLRPRIRSSSTLWDVARHLPGSTFPSASWSS